MQKCFRLIRQNGDGAWFCVNGPGVTYKRGKLVQAVHVAAWLDDWEKHGARPPGVDFL